MPKLQIRLEKIVTYLEWLKDDCTTIEDLRAVDDLVRRAKNIKLGGEK